MDVVEVVKKLLPEKFSFLSLETTSKSELIKKAQNAQYFLASGRLKIDKDVIDAAQNLKMIQRTGVGTDTLDLNYLKENKIPVYLNEGVNSESVAEHTLLLMLSVLRKLPEVNQSVKGGRWKKNEFGIRCENLKGKKIGLIGVGNIGRAVARLLKPFQVKLFYYKRNRLFEEEEQELDLTYLDYKRLLKESDIISLHCPLSEDTRGMLGMNEMNLMKRGSYIINTARGQLIEEEALVKNLQNGHIYGAGLDVFAIEPLPKDSPLILINNTVLTPHTGGLTIETFSDMISQAFQNIELFHKGELDLIKDKLLV